MNDGIPQVVGMGIVGVQPQLGLIALHVENVRIAVGVKQAKMRKMSSAPLPIECSLSCTINLTFYTKYLRFLANQVRLSQKS